MTSVIVSQRKLYEYRHYHATLGKLEAMHKRHEDSILWLLGCWTPTFGGFNNEFIYVSEWDSLAERERVLKQFVQDPERPALCEETNKKGALAARVHVELWRTPTYAPEARVRTRWCASSLGIWSSREGALRAVELQWRETRGRECRGNVTSGH
ncbi:NIPSNAP family protein [Bradyrhizobium sp. USDA 4504]